MQPRATIIAIFGTRQRFLAVLVSADLHASPGWEAEFVSDIRERFVQYGDEMTLTTLQRKQLRRIGGI